MKLITEIKNEGLNKVIEKYNLLSRFADDKVLLKYSQIDSFAHKYELSCREARGIILKLDTWHVYNFGFCRFFNYGETNHSNFNWDDFNIFLKEDGSLMNLYWDDFNDCWQVSTTGTIYGDSKVHDSNYTFKELFWKVSTIDVSNLNRDYIYSFELCTPYNQVVVYHETPRISLLSVKSRLEILNGSYGEFSFNKVKEIAKLINVEAVKSYDLDNIKEITDFVESKDGKTFEGVVLCDNNFNRIKMKNDEYTLFHHNFSALNEVSLFKIILENEQDEIFAYFPHLKQRGEDLQKKLFIFIERCKDYFDTFVKVKQNIQSEKGLKWRKEFFSDWMKYRHNLSVIGGKIERCILNDETLNVFDILKTLTTKQTKTLIKFLDND